MIYLLRHYLKRADNFEVYSFSSVIMMWYKSLDQNILIIKEFLLMEPSQNYKLVLGRKRSELNVQIKSNMFYNYTDQTQKEKQNSQSYLDLNSIFFYPKAYSSK